MGFNSAFKGLKVKQSYPCRGLVKPLGFQEDEPPRVSRKSAHESGPVYTQEIFLARIS